MGTRRKNTWITLARSTQAQAKNSSMVVQLENPNTGKSSGGKFIPEWRSTGGGGSFRGNWLTAKICSVGHQSEYRLSTGDGRVVGRGLLPTYIRRRAVVEKLCRLFVF
jgi:hypothetical protein